MSSTSAATEAASETPAFGGQPVETAADLARVLGVDSSKLLYTLYKAPDSARYRTFEIPKRTGGMREIAAPIGILRQAQDRLMVELVDRYRAHPGAQGFIAERSILSNAEHHVGAKLVLNIDLKDFFPGINFGRIRGLFMSPVFGMGKSAAAVAAQICTRKNGLPQGAPTSPVLSNFIATELDRRLTRLAKQNGMSYSRYADDITFSTNRPAFPASIVAYEEREPGQRTLVLGEALTQEITAAGFIVNEKKIRLQSRSMKQSVTGLTVNDRTNVARERIRRLRAMLHAWAKFGLDAAGEEHFRKRRTSPRGRFANNPGAAFRNIVYGELAFVKMIRGQSDPVYLKLCARLIDLDPNPSKFVRQMIFGAADYEIFISHASEDRPEVARPVHAACERLGLKVFLDDEHIAWGENFTRKINSALGAARTVLCIISPVSVTKQWPMAEVNTALSLEISGKKEVFCLIVGRPDLSHLPLIAGKDFMLWNGDGNAVAKELKARMRRHKAPQPPPIPQPQAPPLPPGPWVKAQSSARTKAVVEPPPLRPSLLSRILTLGRKNGPES